MPIEHTLLQTKAMRIASLARFPFPTPPRADAVTQGLRVVETLGALQRDVGAAMMEFPVSVRCAKMLLSAQQGGCLPFALAVVALLSVEVLQLAPHEMDAKIRDAMAAEQEQAQQELSDKEQVRAAAALCKLPPRPPHRTSWAPTSAAPASPRAPPSARRTLCAERT